MNIVIVGTGAVAAEITSYIQDHNKFSSDNLINVLGYLDFNENIEKYWAAYKLKQPVLGDIYNFEITEDVAFLIGISDLKFRFKMLNILLERKAKITSFIHHTAIIADTSLIGIGNIIYPNCIIGPNCVIGNYNLITSQSIISHDCKVGDNNFFSTAVLCGRVHVNHNNFFGVRSTVLPSVKMGSDNIIQAGMVVDKSLEDNQTVFYRFKEKILAIPKN